MCYNKKNLCKNNEVETNPRQKQPITILSKEPKPANELKFFRTQYLCTNLRLKN